MDDSLRFGKSGLEPATSVIHPPSSIEELARYYSDLLVVGTATAVDRHRTFIYPEQVFSELVFKLFNPSYPVDWDASEQVTDYRVDVKKVVVDRGDTEMSDPEMIIRVARGSTVPVIGQEYLFAVLYNDGEAGDSYSSMFGPKSMFYWDGTTIRYADGDEVPYRCGLTFDEFLESIRVAERPASLGSH